MFPGVRRKAMVPAGRGLAQTTSEPGRKGPRVWNEGVRGEVSSRYAFHWHKQVSLHDTCLSVVLEEAGAVCVWR